MNILFLILVLAAATTNASSQSPIPDRQIEIARQQFIEINGILSRAKHPSISSLDKLRSILMSLQQIDSSQAVSKPLLQKITTKDIHQLDSALIRFHVMNRSHLSVDSLRTIFREIAESFEYTFSNYFHARAMLLRTKKVFLFSVSISCECTLKMCGEHLDALYALKRHYGDKVSILAADTFHNTDLKEKYKIDFSPTLVILDENNIEVQRFVREERIAEKLIHVVE